MILDSSQRLDSFHVRQLAIKGRLPLPTKTEAGRTELGASWLLYVAKLLETGLPDDHPLFAEVYHP